MRPFWYFFWLGVLLVHVRRAFWVVQVVVFEQLDPTKVLVISACRRSSLSSSGGPREELSVLNIIRALYI
jgi:hypothetical protein